MKQAENELPANLRSILKEFDISFLFLFDIKIHVKEQVYFIARTLAKYIVLTLITQ